MADIEKRLRVLEKRARVDDERWQMLDAQTQAFALIREAIVRPICAELVAAERREGLKPKILQVIIENLKKLERQARVLNTHSKMIGELSAVRQLFETLEKKGKRSEPKSGGGFP